MSLFYLTSLLHLNCKSVPDKTRAFKVTPVAATTSDAGQINYTPSSAKPDASAQYVVTQFLTRSVTITLAPKTQKTVTFA